MNWIPPVLQPLDPTMVLLLIGWLLAVSLAIHRSTRYVLQRREVGKWGYRVDEAARCLRQDTVLGLRGDTIVTRLCSAIRQSPAPRALERFHEQTILPKRGPDQWNDRVLASLGQIAPLVGLIGTVVGILMAFADLASKDQMTTLRDLAGPVSLALKTTLYGAMCAAFCIAVRAAFPVTEVHSEADRQILVAWETLRPLIHKPRVSKRRTDRRNRPRTFEIDMEGAGNEEA